MINIKKILLCFILFVLFDINASASSYYVYCENEDKKIKEEFDCTVKVMIEKSSISFDLEYDDTISLVNEEINENWELDKNNNSYYLKQVNDDVLIDVIKFKFKVNSTDKSYAHVLLSNVKIDDVTESDEEGIIHILSNNANLNNLYADGMSSINFEHSKTTYDLLIRNDQNSIYVGCELDSEYASFVEGYECNKDISFNSDNGQIIIKVKAEDDTIKDYIINVSRQKDLLDDNNYLKSLVLTNGYLNFQKDVLDYTVNLPYQIDSINIYVEPESANATYEFNGTGALNVGSNLLQVKVIAENGQEKVYSINVIREEKSDVQLNNNNYLKDLNIDGYNIDFQKDTLTYVLSVDNYDTLKIDAIPEDVKAKVVIQGNYDLNYDSSIRIIVTAENGENKEYVVKVRKEEDSENLNEKNNINKSLIIGTIIGLVLGISIIIAIVIKKKRNKYNLK